MSWAAMPHVVAIVALVLVARAVDHTATPVGKVVDLLTNLKKEVQDEGKREATTYQKFASFCKTSTESKSNEVTKGADKIDDLSATIEAKSAEKKDKQATMGERTQTQEKMSAELDEETARCMKEERSYDSKSLELTKAISGIRSALKSLANAKKGGAASSFLDLHSSVSQSLEFAEALEMVQAPARRDVTAFLQQTAKVDPDDAQYKFHSSNIVSVLTMLQKNYGKSKAQLDKEWTTTDSACKLTKTALSKDLKNNKDAITKLSEKADGLAKDIAKAKEDLVSEQTALQDAEVYLKDLTHRCEARAKDWDQRSATRDEEFQALSSALETLSGRVKAADKANKRALLLSTHTPVVAKAHFHLPSQRKPVTAPHKTALTSTQITITDGTTAEDSTEIATELTALEDDDGAEAQAQDGMPSAAATSDVTSWLHEGPVSLVQVNALTVESQAQVLANLQQEGRRLGSASLASLSMQMAGNPFRKIKGLIQDLLERLLRESAGEATKKGFCDEELGKTKQARDYNLEEAKKLNAEINVLKADRESLDTEADELKDRIEDLNKEFAEAGELRELEKKDHSEALEKAQDGLEGVTEAYDLLKGFYDKAGSAVLLQASPVDEDAPGAPEGDYKGKQGAAKGILGLLQVIMSDFERTLKTTSSDEKKSASDFEEMKQNSEADIAGHTTKRELDMHDSRTSATVIKKKNKDMQFANDAVDANLQILKDLKPTCVDHGRMSFKERTAMREDEMAALKRALCKLDAEGVEAGCK